MTVRLVNVVTGHGTGMAKHALALPPGAGVTEWYCANGDKEDGYHAVAQAQEKDLTSAKKVVPLCFGCCFLANKTIFRSVGFQF